MMNASAFWHKLGTTFNFFSRYRLNRWYSESAGELGKKWEPKIRKFGKAKRGK